MKRKVKASLLIGSVIMFSSCATFLRKDKVQTITFDPEQENTMVFVNNEFIGESPVEIKADPTKTYEVTYVKKSYVTETFALKNGVLGKWLIADLACLPLTAVVPVIVDASTGAWKGIKTNRMPKSLLKWSEVEDPHDYVDNLFQIENLYFEVGKEIIKEEAKPNLDKLVDILSKHPDVKLAIHGHTDVTGNHDANVQLSLDRANAVKAYLVEKGIESSRISTTGHGPDVPLVDGDSEEAYQYNRRVEFEYKL